MTVAENIAQYAGYPTGLLGIRWPRPELSPRALKPPQRRPRPRHPVGELSIAEQATVILPGPYFQNAKLIVLDEPTASLAAG